jgi:hypothetical protein
MPGPPERPPLPPPPAPETLRGVIDGILSIKKSLAEEAAKAERRHAETTNDVADVHQEVLYHGVRLKRVEEAVALHTEQIIELQRLPRVRQVKVSVDQPIDLGRFVDAGDSGIHKIVEGAEIQKWLEEKKAAELALQKALEEHDLERERAAALRNQKWVLSKIGVVVVALAVTATTAIVTLSVSVLLDKARQTSGHVEKSHE